MKISGKHIIEAPVEAVWQKILDPAVLERVTPGIDQLEKLAADRYKAIADIRMGPVKGRFTGSLAIEDKVAPESCTIVLDQKSKIGNVKASITLKLVPLADYQTAVGYTGEARMSGMLARMGQRLLGGVVSTLAKQFFSAFEKEVNG